MNYKLILSHPRALERAFEYAAIVTRRYVVAGRRGMCVLLLQLIFHV